MGKTRPTYRNKIKEFEQEWQPFRRALRNRDQPHFDQLMAHAHYHATPGNAQNELEPKWSILVSMLVGQQAQISELREQLEE